MCTVIVLRRPDAEWPLLFAANRDESKSRPWLPPARHWPDRPDVVAGKDILAGGSWLGINDHGVIAAILNRPGSLGPGPDTRSRGELVLEALDHADAADAADALGAINPAAYRTFNLVIADNRDAFWLANRDNAEALTCEPLPDGISVFTSADMNDPYKPRVARFKPQFESACVPNPSTGDWSAWEGLMAVKAANGVPADEGMCIDTGGDYGTVSSSLLALPQSGKEIKPVFRFAASRPGAAAYEAIDLGGPVAAAS